MIRVALIGEIGSGKSYLAKLFRYPVFCADKEVVKIYQKDEKFFIKLKKKLNSYFFSFPLKKDQLIKCILDKKNNLKINLEGKFTTERGRINCSLREKNNFYRWLGIQFVVKEIKN